MTTLIKITACCADTKEVKIVSEDANGPTEVIIQDGETHELHIYDDIICAVQEVEKIVDPAALGPGGPGCEKC